MSSMPCSLLIAATITQHPPDTSKFMQGKHHPRPVPTITDRVHHLICHLHHLRSRRWCCRGFGSRRWLFAFRCRFLGFRRRRFGPRCGSFGLRRWLHRIGRRGGIRCHLRLARRCRRAHARVAVHGRVRGKRRCCALGRCRLLGCLLARGRYGQRRRGEGTVETRTMQE